MNAPADSASLVARMVPGERSVRIGEKQIRLTAVEFLVLQMLLGRAGEVVPRGELYPSARNPGSNVLEVTLSRIRSKLKQAAVTEVDIQTVRSRGYKLVVLPA